MSCNILWRLVVEVTHPLADFKILAQQEKVERVEQVPVTSKQFFILEHVLHTLTLKVANTTV